ncbi:MAG: hypothetical protein PHU21_13080, partial [Elusimicrobia bacterium]|nr:hypothetical protein [Elusimicrobiota bacterium]
FTLFAFLAALIDPNIPSYPLLLFMLLLVNIFVPAGLLFAAESVAHVLARAAGLWKVDWRVWPKAKAEMLEVRLREAWPSRWEFLALGANLYALFYITATAQQHSAKLAWGPFGNIVLFLLMFVAWGKIMMVLRDRRVSYLALTGLAAALVWGAAFRHWDVLAIVVKALKMTFSFGVFISVARLVFHWYIEQESLRELRPEHLAPGAVLSDKTWQSLEKDPQISGQLGRRYSDGLTQEEVDALKAWLAARPASEQYTVYQTIPFAVWIFMGSLYTVARRENLVTRMLPYGERAWELLKAGARALA